ncbi:MAG: ABC transporter permease subunit [Gemmatimonadota bacterium]|nr:ABC transporter permease subunit [Gemmatimonadota bacterium]MDE2984517.1 ABC transporter permease subunit [Gemmatimonadota bacterium]
MKSLFLLTLRRVLAPTRLLMIAGLALVPFAVTSLILLIPDAPPVQIFEQLILNTLLAGAIIPLATLATGRAAFGDEISDRTLANITLTPNPRWKIVLPKLLAVVCVPVLIMAVSAYLTGYLGYGGDRSAAWAVTIGAMAAVVLYSTLFVWLDLVTPHAVGIGLAYIVVWEGLFSRFVYGVRFFSIRSYATSVTHGVDERRFADGVHTGLGLTVAVMAVVVAVLFLLSVRRLRTMDSP